MVVLLILATTVVTMILRQQFRPAREVIEMEITLDDGSEGALVDLNSPEDFIMAEEVTTPKSQGSLDVQQKQMEFNVPKPLPDNSTYFNDFQSPFIDDADPKNPYAEFQLSRAAMKNVTGKKVITWYSVASESLREDLFDESVFDECPVSKCKFLRSLGGKPDKHVDAVIFPGVAGREKPPVSRSRPDQVFIYYDMDPPIRPAKAFGGPEWNSIFNWTWSYRMDADIWEPFGTLKKTDKVKSSTFFKDVTKDKSKTRHVAWFVSSCHVLSQREKYVEELRKYVNVDIYGQCGNKTCPKSFECLEMLTQKYWFYLSFESALCKDYVTDKFFHMFFEGIHVIPVVMGGADYARFFPEGSYIDVNWFPSPKELADFLKLLMEEKKTYAEFLWRKSHYVFPGPSTTSALCQLCQRLHDRDRFRRTYPDLQAWYRGQQCTAPRQVWQE